MQGNQHMVRPTDPTHIAYAGTDGEMWWNGQEWTPAIKAEPEYNLAALIQVHNAIRDARAARQRLWEKEDAELKDDQHKLKLVMLEMLNATGAKSVATEVGTVYRTERVKASAADWGAIYAWIGNDPERFEIFEKRLKVNFVKDYMENHNGETPPGINVFREFEVNVRKPTNTD